MGEAGLLNHKCLCRDHFLPSDFQTPEGIRLNRLAVPRALDSASHSIPQPSPPLLPTLSNPQPSPVSPWNFPLLPPLPLTPEENYLQVLPPLRTYSKLRSSSTHIETPLPTHIDGPSTSSPICVPNPTAAAANILSVEDTSLSLSLDSSDGEFGCKISTNSVQFPWFVYKIPFHVDARPMSKVLETKEERMSDQSKEAHSFPRKFSRNKQTEIVRIHKVHIRLQVERSNFWTDREKQNKRNTALWNR